MTPGLAPATALWPGFSSSPKGRISCQQAGAIDVDTDRIEFLDLFASCAGDDGVEKAIRREVQIAVRGRFGQEDLLFLFFRWLLRI